MDKDFVLNIPAEVYEAVKLPAGEVARELHRELAVALYRRGALALGKARVLAQMTRWEFDQLLGERKIPRHYTDTDLEEDVRYARSGQ